MVFSDETKINYFNAHERSWYWINDKENITYRVVKQTMKHGGGFVKL